MNDFICKYCGKQCKNKNSLAQHEIRCKENPKRINCQCNNFNNCGRIPWNKGLTKESDKRIKNQAEKYKQNYKDGKFKVWCDGLTKETDKRVNNLSAKISDTVTNKSKDGNWHVSFSKSNIHAYNGIKLHGTWELNFAKFLDSKNIKWERPNIQVEYIFEDQKHYYTPDFYLVDFNIYIETKGYPVKRDFKKWEYFKKLYNLDIYFGDDLYNLNIIDSFKNMYNDIPNELRKKHLDLLSFL